MSGSVGLLEFFVLEASEYLEQLDGLIASSGPAGPDPDELMRRARMLRGSATMARQTAIGDLAGGIERIARALRGGSLAWDPRLHGAIVAAVDDLKLLVRAVRSWGPGEEQRAYLRTTELARFAPDVGRSTPTPSAGGTGRLFLMTEAAEIANGLDAFVADPSDRSALDGALARTRALRGVAAIKDLPPLPEVVEAVERAAKPVELGTQPGAEQLELLAASAALLRQAAADLRIGGKPATIGSAVERFAAASTTFEGSHGDADHIVPISALYHDDGGPHVVEAAPHPPTTPAERFRLEVVSQAEHLRRLIADARAAQDIASRDRVARELAQALRALRGAAESFGEGEVARFVASMGEAAGSLEPVALDALDELAALLASPSTSGGEIAHALGNLSRGGGAGVRAASAGGPPPAPSRPKTPTGRQLQQMLQTGISGIGRLAERPLSQPVAIVDETIVPIDTLLYRGRAALDRARELRDEIRRAGGTPPKETLEELLDLLELAATE